MGWEIRGSRRYYTRSHKRQGRVVREYVGGGLAGHLAAREDAERRRRCQEARDALQREQETFAAAAAPHERLSAVAEALMAAALTEAGYHRPGRHRWRKRRDHDERNGADIAA